MIDRRDHVSRGMHTTGWMITASSIHKYGPHIFHTNSKKVWDYLSRFTAWRPYYHHVLAVVEGREVPVPFNLNSIEALFPRHMAGALSRRADRPARVRQEGADPKAAGKRGCRPAVPGRLRVSPRVRNLYAQAVGACASEDLDPAVTARVPIYISRDDRYFQDTYQAMPQPGYTALFEQHAVGP